MAERIRDVRAERQALLRAAMTGADAEIAALRADVARLTQERDEAVRMGAEGLSRYRARAAQAEAERDALKQALVFYANEDGWTYDSVYIDNGFTRSEQRRAITDDDVDEQGAGKLARAALAPEQEAQRPGSTSSGAELRDMLQAAEQGLEEMNRQLGIRIAPEQEAQHGD